MTSAQGSQAYGHIIADIQNKEADLKLLKTEIRNLEKDYPMELEELELSLKDLKKQFKAGKDEHINNLLANNVDYAEFRERVQLLKEEIVQKKLELFTLAQNESRDQGSIDRTVMVEGAPMRLQSQEEVVIYLNGKPMKAPTA